MDSIFHTKSPNKQSPNKKSTNNESPNKDLPNDKSPNQQPSNQEPPNQEPPNQEPPNKALKQPNLEFIPTSGYRNHVDFSTKLDYELCLFWQVTLVVARIFASINIT